MNLNEIKKHYDAFWENSFIDRCCLHVIKKGEAAVPEPKSLTQQWEDIEFRCRQAAHRVENTKYFADAFPGVVANFGPGCLAEFVGGSFKWAPNTVWFDHEQFITDIENPPELKLNKNSFIFKLAEFYTNELFKIDNIIPGIPDIGGSIDVIAALRGTQELLYDLYDYPDKVSELNKSLRGMWLESANYFSRLILEKKGVMTSWIPVLSDKQFFPLQCDFSAMISPDMFSEFVMPELEFQTERLPRSIYHLDGVSATKHLDSLLSLKKLNAIQWSPGAGQPTAGEEQWFEMYHKIQTAGKGLVLLGVLPEHAENVFRKLSPNGLFVNIECTDEKQAEELIESAVKR